MFSTRVTEMLGIRYPIIQGGMAGISGAKLAAAVSNAGGLGIIVSSMFSSGEELRKEIRKAKELTDQPFGVNISLFPSIRLLPNDEFVDVVCEEGVAAVETSGVRSPEEFVPRLKQANVKIIHKCAGVRYAMTAERVGADAVTVVGFENGGATGMNDTTTFVLIPQTVDAVNIPVIGGGGIGDARGFLAALALGAEGVVMGTRFMATHECPVHPKFKEWLLRATATDTVIVERSIRNTHRVLRNAASQRVEEMEARGASLEELLPVIAGVQGRKVWNNGDLEAGIVSCGQVVGLVNELKSVKEVIEGIVQEAAELHSRLGGVVGA